MDDNYHHLHNHCIVDGIAGDQEKCADVLKITKYSFALYACSPLILALKLDKQSL